jgi:hypothetical protein
MGPPDPAPDLAAGIKVPDYAKSYRFG